MSLIRVPFTTDTIQQTLGGGAEHLPELNQIHFESFLNGYFFAHAETFDKARLLWIERDLRRLGVLTRKEVSLSYSNKHTESIVRSVEKLSCLRDIATLELELLQDQLRMVILADYVYKEDLPTNSKDARSPKRLGVASIFELLRRSPLDNARLAILTGSLVIIPADAVEHLDEACGDCQMDRKNIRTTPCAFDSQFHELSFATNAANSKKVALVTRIFYRGHINIIIGTTALLGEGWDAPSANTLILASGVSSYMLSNQMRGRVVRVDPNRKDKAAHIWHLVTVPPRQNLLFRHSPKDSQGLPEYLGTDFDSLKRRFTVFEGITLSEPIAIRRGLDRLNFSNDNWGNESIQLINERMKRFCMHRKDLIHLWDDAIHDGEQTPTMNHRIKAAPRNLKFTHAPSKIRLGTVAFFLGTGVAFGFAGMGSIATWLLIAAVVTCPVAITDIAQWARLRTLEKSFRNILAVSIDSYQSYDLIVGSDAAEVTVNENNNGVVTILISGLRRSDQIKIYSALEELLKPIEKARYIIAETTFLSRKEIYRPVPRLLAKNKKMATCFAEQRSRRVKSCYLVYSGNLSGKSTLFQSRLQSYLASQESAVSRQWTWD